VHPSAEDATPGQVVFKSSIARPELLLTVAEGLLGASCPEASAIEKHERLMARANSLVQWIFMLLALCSSDEIVRQQLETAWASVSRGIVRLLWQKVLRPALEERQLKPLNACDDESAPPWVLPLAALCSFYSHFVSTQPDEQVFSKAVRYQNSRTT
jgi:hypothetical protein